MKKARAKPAAPAATTYDYDVFISYSSKDKEWARGEFLKRIEDAGLHAFIENRVTLGGTQVTPGFRGGRATGVA